MSIVSKKSTSTGIDSYYRFVLLTAQQTELLNYSKNFDSFNLSMQKLIAHLEEIPKRAWNRLRNSHEAVSHIVFLFCGIDAFSILLRYGLAESSTFPSGLESELKGLSRLIRKFVRRAVDDRDWRADMFGVVREAQRLAILLFYMLKSSVPQRRRDSENEQTTAKLTDASNSNNCTADDTVNSLSNAYIKARLDRLLKQLDELRLMVLHSNNTNVRMLLSEIIQLRTGVGSF